MYWKRYYFVLLIIFLMWLNSLIIAISSPYSQNKFNWYHNHRDDEPVLVSQAPDFSSIKLTRQVIDWDFESVPVDARIDVYYDVAEYGYNYLPDRHTSPLWVYVMDELVNTTSSASINPEDNYSANFRGTGMTNLTTSVTGLEPNTSLSFAIGLAILNKTPTTIEIGLKQGTNRMWIEFNANDGVIENIYVYAGDWEPLNTSSYFNTTKYTTLCWNYYIFNISDVWLDRYGGITDDNMTVYFFLFGTQIDCLIDYWYLGTSLVYNTITYLFENKSGLAVNITSIMNRVAIFNLSYLFQYSSFHSFVESFWVNLTIVHLSEPINISIIVYILETDSVQKISVPINDSQSINVKEFIPTGLAFRLVKLSIDAVCRNLTEQSFKIKSIKSSLNWLYLEAFITKQNILSRKYEWEFGQNRFKVSLVCTLIYESNQIQTWYIVFNVPINSIVVSEIMIGGAQSISLTTFNGMTIIKYNLTTMPNLTSKMFSIVFYDLVYTVTTEYIGPIPYYAGDSDSKVVRVNITKSLAYPDIDDSYLIFNKSMFISIGVYERYDVYNDYYLTSPANDVLYQIGLGVLDILGLNFTGLKSRILYIHASSRAPIVTLIAPNLTGKISSDTLTIQIKILDDSQIKSIKVKLVDSESMLLTSPIINGIYDDQTLIWSATISLSSYWDGKKYLYIRVEDEYRYSVEQIITFTLDRGTTQKIIGIIFCIIAIIICFIFDYKVYSKRKIEIAT